MLTEFEHFSSAKIISTKLLRKCANFSQILAKKEAIDLQKNTILQQILLL